MDAPDPLIGRQAGPFRLERKLGEGGMGSVYFARRVAEFDQVAAVKIGLFETGHRFLAERQALAALQHPDIVRLIDGGVTPDGLRFLAMEYVEGAPIDRYCRESNLGAAARTRLVIRLLHAVHHAHQHLFVHCDLKFSNILVTPDGDPKILDFGIAKILEPERYGLDLPPTRLGARPFTPECASPEQLRGQPLTTATDIYSMGVVLYALLAGAHPFEAVKTQPIAFMNAVLEQEPEPASRRIPTLRAKETGRDLDAILGKAMRKAPEDRYATAAQFAADLERWIGGEPVEARRGSRWRRFRRTVARHCAAVGAAGLVMALLLSGAGAAFWQGYRAERARAQAKGRFDEVRKLTNELAFGFYDELQKLPGSTAAQQSVVTWSIEHLHQLAAQSAGDPALSVEIAETFRKLGDLEGNPYESNLGRPREALETIDRGLAAVQPVLNRDPDRKDALLAKTRLLSSRADVQMSLGAAAEALGGKRAAIEMVEDLARRYPNDPEVLMEACSQHETHGDMLGGAMMNYRDAEGAVRAYTSAREFGLRAARTAPDQGRPQRAAIILGMKLADQLTAANPAAALAEFERTRAAFRELPAKLRDEIPTRRAGASLLRRHGWALAQAGRPAEAIPLYLESAALYEPLAAIDRANLRAQWDLAVVYQAIGEAEQAAGRPERALEAYRKLVALLEPLNTPESPLHIRRGFGEALVRQGSLAWDLGDRAAGRAASSRGLRILAETLGAGAPATEVERTAQAFRTVRPPDLRR